jgi:two pore calcium channel protein 3
MIGQLFLYNLMLGVTSDQFQMHTKNFIHRRLKKRIEGMDAAFEILADLQDEEGRKASNEIRNPVAQAESNSAESVQDQTQNDGGARKGSKGLVGVERGLRKNPLTKAINGEGGDARGKGVEIEMVDVKDGGTDEHLQHPQQQHPQQQQRRQPERPGPAHPVSPSRAVQREYRGITRKLWTRLFDELQAQDVSKYDPEVVAILFEVLDRDLAEVISKSEFRGLLSLIDLRFTLKPDWEHERSDVRKRMVQVLQYSHTEDILDLFVYANSVLLIMSFYNSSESIELALNLFLLFMSIELVAKMYAFGPAQYLKSDVFNQVDFVAIVGGVIMFVFTSVHDTSIDRKAATTARLFRGARVLRGLRGFKSMLVSFGFAFKGFLTYLAAIFVMFYMYAIVGMELFGERIGTREQMCCLPNSLIAASTYDLSLCPSTCADYEAVLATSYGGSHYWSINFNTLGSSLFALFYLMIVNNWPVLMEGYVAAVGSQTLWPRMYFYLWYIIMVLVMLNIVQAFLLNSFLTQRLFADQQERERDEHASEGSTSSSNDVKSRGSLSRGSLSRGSLSSLDTSLPVDCCLERLLCCHSGARGGDEEAHDAQDAQAGGTKSGNRVSSKRASNFGKKKKMSRSNKTAVKLPLWQMLLYSTVIRKSRREQAEDDPLPSSAYNLFTKYHIRKTAHFADLQENLLLDQNDVNKLEQLLVDGGAGRSTDNDQRRDVAGSSGSNMSAASAPQVDDSDAGYSTDGDETPDTDQVSLLQGGGASLHHLRQRGGTKPGTAGPTRGSTVPDGGEKRIHDFTQAGLQRPRGSSIGEELGIAEDEMGQILQLATLQSLARTKVGLFCLLIRSESTVLTHACCTCSHKWRSYRGSRRIRNNKTKSPRRAQTRTGAASCIREEMSSRL